MSGFTQVQIGALEEMMARFFEASRGGGSVRGVGVAVRDGVAGVGSGGGGAGGAEVTGVDGSVGVVKVGKTDAVVAGVVGVIGEGKELGSGGDGAVGAVSGVSGRETRGKVVVAEAAVNGAEVPGVSQEGSGLCTGGGRCVSPGLTDSSSGESVVLLPDRPKSAGSASLVVFGGQDELRDEVRGNFFKHVVRSPNVKAYAAFLADRVDVKISKVMMRDLALVSFTAGTVPDAFVRGREELKILENVGDAALALCLVELMARIGKVVSSVQNAKNSHLSNPTFTRAFVRVGLAGFVSYAPGVDVNSAKSSANAFEALAGVLYLHKGLAAVEKLMRFMGLLNVT